MHRLEGSEGLIVPALFFIIQVITVTTVKFYCIAAVISFCIVVVPGVEVSLLVVVLPACSNIQERAVGTDSPVAVQTKAVILRIPVVALTAVGLLAEGVESTQLPFRAGHIVSSHGCGKAVSRYISAVASPALGKLEPESAAFAELNGNNQAKSRVRGGRGGLRSCRGVVVHKTAQRNIYRYIRLMSQIAVARRQRVHYRILSHDESRAHCRSRRHIGECFLG